MTNTHLSTLPPLSIRQKTPEDVADACAERLMDELFGNIDRALAGDIDALADAAPLQPTKQGEALAEPTLSFSDGGLPAVLLADEPASSPVLAPSMLATTAPGDAVDTDAVAAVQTERRWSVNKALLGLAGISLLGTLGLWLYQRQSIPTAAPPLSTTTDISTVNGAQAEFLDYLGRSLNVIAQRSGETPPGLNADVPTVASLPGSGVLGLPPIGDNTLSLPSVTTVPSANTGSINVIERVYIPYQAPVSGVTAVGAPASPSATSPSTAGTAALPLAAVHTLLGVLELGDRSAALFEIDGIPQRVYIGERIGGSGWSLVSVGNEEAVMRRNGEVRSIYIGQQF